MDEQSITEPLATLWALACFYVRIVPAGWYRRAPFLPLPPAAYVRWRLRTAYGKHRPRSSELLRDLWQFGGWLRSFDRN